MSFSWLQGVDLAWPAALVTLLYLVLLIWCITRPRDQMLLGAPDKARWRDLRYWAVPLILIQIALHWLLI